jgi:hypothetical protein
MACVDKEKAEYTMSLRIPLKYYNVIQDVYKFSKNLSLTSKYYAPER